MHHKRRLLIAAALTGGLTVGLGTFASPANAVVRTFEVTGILGKKTITLDIGADTPVDQIRLPGINLGAILSIRETTPAQAPSSGGAPLLQIKPTPAAPAAPSAISPVLPSAPAESQSSRGKKGKPSVGQPVFDSAGRLLRAAKPERARPAKTKLRFSSGVPTLQNPTLSLASIGPVPVGVPNFFINKFRIPPFLLSIYQAAGIQYGIRWEVLAAINEIETDYGRNLNVSSAGAMGWMQFIPSSWKTFGVDANSDGKKDPYNPVDAIFAAARYLKAAGADQDLRKAIFAYNHADWYVDSVLMRARFIGGMPSDLAATLAVRHRHVAQGGRSWGRSWYGRALGVVAGAGATLLGAFLFPQPELVDAVLQDEEAAEALPTEVGVVALEDGADLLRRLGRVELRVDPFQQFLGQLLRHPRALPAAARGRSRATTVRRRPARAQRPRQLYHRGRCRRTGSAV
jgi:soluble lytic murein transglycosylase-like protein